MFQKVVFCLVAGLHFGLFSEELEGRFQIRGLKALAVANQMAMVVSQNDELSAREKRSELANDIKIVQAVQKKPLPNRVSQEKCDTLEKPASGWAFLQCWNKSNRDVRICLDVDTSDLFLETDVQTLEMGSGFNLDSIKCSVIIK